MNRRRISISILMLVIAAVAVNLAVGRAMYDHHPETLCASACIMLSLQVGLVHVIRRRVKVKTAFWAGWAVSGSAALGTLLAAEQTGTSCTFWYFVWSQYVDLAVRCIRELPGGARVLAPGWNHAKPDVAYFVMSMIVLALPQILVAGTGGLLAGIGFKIANRRIT